MVVRMRHTSGHTRNRRAHHKLEKARFSMDGGTPHLRHRATTAGTYRGRVVIDTVKIAEKKASRAKAKAKERGMESSGENRSPEAAPLETTTEKTQKKTSKKK